MTGPWSIERIPLPAASGDVDDLADVLLDAVAGGASISFMADLTHDQAIDYWRGCAAGLHERGAFLVARNGDGHIDGTVQLVPAWPPNQPHRADIAKLIVHRRARGNGLGARLMAEVERIAAENGFTLLVLDTASAEAEHIYRKRGWVELGVIPNFALNPDGTFCDTVMFWKAL